MRSIRRAAEADWPSVWSIISPVAAAGHTYFLETDISEAAAKEYWMGLDSLPTSPRTTGRLSALTR